MQDTLTVPASLAGIPAISVPFGKSSSGLPVGMQLISRRLNEIGALRAAAILEQ